MVQLAGLALVVFFAIRLLPADPVARLVGQNASRDAYLSSRHSLGLDQPLLEQFGRYLGVIPGSSGLLDGDFGRSWVSGDPILTPPPSVTGFITIDSLLAGNAVTFRDGVHHLMLPVLTKVFVLSGPIVKMVRQNMVRVMASDYVLYEQASGLRRGRIAAIALKNALVPALTLLGVLYGYILGGAVLIETVFSLGGIGQYAVRSVLAFDYPAIQAVVLVIAMISLFVYLALDVVHALLDRRLQA